MNFKRLLNNWPEKLIALIVASGIWVYATLGASSIVNFPGKINIEMRNTSPALIAISDQDQASIKIKSDSVNLKKITSDNFKAYTDLTGLGVGVYEKDLVVESNNAQVQIIDKNPKKITVRIEPISKKNIPVRVEFVSRAANGYSAIEREVEPKAIEASGPESEINLLSEAVAKIKLSGESKDFEKMVSLSGMSASGDELKNISFDPASVKVSVLVSNSTQTKTVAIKAITAGKLATGFQISDIKYEPNFITVTGPTDVVSGLRLLETKPIDISNLKESKTFTATLNVPSGIVLEEKSDQIKVAFTLVNSESFKKIMVKVKPINIEPSQSLIGVEPSEVEINLRGASDVLSGIDGSNYTVELDLKGIRNSTVTVPVGLVVGLPDSLEFISAGPSSVKVTLSEN